jgi:hypothetical protein
MFENLFNIIINMKRKTKNNKKYIINITLFMIDYESQSSKSILL